VHRIRKGADRILVGHTRAVMDVPRADVSGPREQQDVVMADAAPERDAVINTVGGRAEGNPVAPTPLERPQVPPMQDRELTSEQARQRSIKQTMACCMALQPIWRSAPRGTENMARRTGIEVSPTVG